MVSVADLFALAVRIEQNGEAFYRRAEREARGADVRVVFEYLASEEAEHQRTFRTLANDLKDVSLPAAAGGQYFTFLHMRVNQLVFATAETSRPAVEFANPASVIDFGLQRESDSVFLYQELKKLVAESLHVVLDGIIEQEVKHYLKLTELREKF